MRKAGLLVLALLALYIIPIQVVQITNASTAIDFAINEGVQYIIRSVAFLDSSYSRAVVRDHPSIPITLVWNDRVYMAGGFLDPGNRDYYHELVSAEQNRLLARYHFNLDADLDYDVTLLVNVTNVDQTKDVVTIMVEKCDLNGVKLYVGSYGRVVNGDTIYQGYSKTWTEQYTYTVHYSNRYVARHSTRIAAWLLEDIGYYEFSEPLHAFMNELGFVYDVYAPVFGRSNSYPDDFFDKAIETWIGAGYNTHPWVFGNGLSLYPYKSRVYIFSELGITDVAIRGWKEAPLYKLLMAIHLLNKYGSSRASDARTLIGQALYEGGWDGYGLSKARLELDYVWYNNRNLCESLPLSDQLLSVLGVFVPLHPGCAWIYSYKGYPVYLNAVLLVALVRYYLVTGQSTITYAGVTYNVLDIADRLADILVRTQWIYEQNTPWGTLRLALYRGGWAAAYDVSGGQLVVKPSAWGLIDVITNGVDEALGAIFSVGYALKEFLKRFGVQPPVDFTSADAVKGVVPMPGEWPTVVNSESTILAVQALRVYKQLNRLPVQTPVSVLPQGRFVAAGGEGNCGRGWTALGGHLIFAYADYPGYTGCYRYQYARFNITLSLTGNHSLIVRGLARYYLEVVDGGAGASLVVKVYDANMNLLNSTTVNIDNTTSGVKNTASPIHVVMNFTAPTTVIIVEVGVRAWKVGLGVADVGHQYGDYDHYLYVDSVIAVPQYPLPPLLPVL